MIKVLVMLLCFVFFFTGCSGQNKNNLLIDQTTSFEVTDQIPDSTAGEKEDIPKKYGDLHYEEITIAMPGYSNVPRMQGVVEKLNELTLENINTTINVMFIQDVMAMPTRIPALLNSGNCDVVYSDNFNLFNNNFYQYTMPYLATQGLIMEVSDLMKKYAPSLYKAYNDEYIYRHLMYVNEGIYGLSFKEPSISMPIVMVRKNLVPNDYKIETMDDVYYLSDEIDAKGYKFATNLLGQRSLFRIFSNINDCYLLPDMRVFGGYVHDLVNDKIVRFEDTEILNDMKAYYENWDKHGILDKKIDFEQNDRVGIALFDSVLKVPNTKDYQFFPLHTDKRFQIDYKNAVSMVVSANAKYPERTLILFDYLFSDKKAYDLACFGVEDVDYSVQDGTYKGGTRMFFMFNYMYEPPAWPDITEFRRILDSCIQCAFMSPYDELIYKDFDLLSAYSEKLGQIKDEFQITQRNDAFRNYDRTSSVEPKEETNAFYQMLSILHDTDDYSQQIFEMLQEFVE